MRCRGLAMGYRRMLRWAAVPITDRRWAAPLSAIALGFGLFIGVAIGPGAAGTLATGAVQIVEVPSFGETNEDVAEGDRGDETRQVGAAGNPHSPTLSADTSSAFLSLPLSEPEPEGEAPIEADEGGQPEAKLPPSDKMPEEEEETIEGVVVHLNKAAGSYVVAGKGGDLTSVHAPTVPQAGTEVEVPLRPLANGTYAEAGQRLRVGSETRATASGIVTFVDPDPGDPTYVLSKRGVSMLVHVAPDPSGVLPALPELGAFATVAVEIEKRDPLTQPSEGMPVPVSFVLWQRHLEVDGAPLAYGDFAGIVAAVYPDSNQLLLSADDVRESERDLLFDVPEDFDLLRLAVGASILATATIEPDGRLSLTGLADDEHRHGADDSEALQGDLTAN